MKKETLSFIEHILESIEKIEDYSKNLTKERLEENTKDQDAIIRRIEIIGEAVKNISHNFRDKHPEIEWKEIAGTKDILTHHYFGVDINEIWDIAKKDLPSLKKKILKIREELKKEKK